MTPLRGRFPGLGIPLAGLLILAGLAWTAPASAADIANGGRLYARHCESCHGATGAPTLIGAPDFKRTQALLRPDAQLVQSIKRGRGAMPAYVGIMNERELLDVVAYMRTLN